MQRTRTLVLLFALTVTLLSLELPAQPAFSLPPAVPAMAPMHNDLPARVPATRQHPAIL